MASTSSIYSRSRVIGLMEDDQADIAQAWLAMDQVWQILRALCYRPMADADVDALSMYFRQIEAGLLANKRQVKADKKKA